MVRAVATVLLIYALIPRTGPASGMMETELPTGPDVVVTSAAREQGRLRVMVWRTAERYGVDPALVFAVIEVESSWNPRLVHLNSDGSRDWGLLQVNDRTWPWLAERVGLEGADPLDPRQNLEMGTWLLAYLSRRYGPDPHRILGAYNMGESGYQRYEASRGTARSEYSRAVLGRNR